MPFSLLKLTEFSAHERTLIFLFPWFFFSMNSSTHLWKSSMFVVFSFWRNDRLLYINKWNKSSVFLNKHLSNCLILKGKHFAWRQNESHKVNQGALLLWLWNTILNNCDVKWQWTSLEDYLWNFQTAFLVTYGFDVGSWRHLHRP